MLTIVFLILLFLQIPLILKKVPINRVFGYRTPYNTDDNQIWYDSNRYFSIILALGSIIILIFRIISIYLLDYVEEIRIINAISIIGIIISSIIAITLTGKRYNKKTQ